MGEARKELLAGPERNAYYVGCPWCGGPALRNAHGWIVHGWCGYAQQVDDANLRDSVGTPTERNEG